MKKLLWVLVAFVAGFLGSKVPLVHAQTAVALQLTGNAPHTSCTVTTGITSYCLASDGLFQSISGGALVQLATVGTTAGLTGITICSASGTNCVAATVTSGVVTLNIPKTATAPPLSVSSGNLVVGAPTLQ